MREIERKRNREMLLTLSLNHYPAALIHTWLSWNGAPP